MEFTPLEEVAKSDIEAVSKATGARIVSVIDDLSDLDLGTCNLLEEVMVNDEPLVKALRAHLIMKPLVFYFVRQPNIP